MAFSFEAFSLRFLLYRKKKQFSRKISHSTISGIDSIRMGYYNIATKQEKVPIYSEIREDFSINRVSGTDTKG